MEQSLAYMPRAFKAFVVRNLWLGTIGLLGATWLLAVWVGRGLAFQQLLLVILFCWLLAAGVALRLLWLLHQQSASDYRVATINEQASGLWLNLTSRRTPRIYIAATWLTLSQTKKSVRLINILIVGADLKDQALTNELTELRATMDTSDQMALQQIQDILALQDRLSKRSADLWLTRELTIQQAPQIRLIQNTNTILAEKIQASLTTAIPLWKNQVMIALTLLNQKNAVSAQSAVADATNELLKKNSKLLKQSTLDVAKASQRGVIDVATLRQTQADLLATIEEALQIQQEGHATRQALEGELTVLEQDLQTKLSK